MDFDYEDDDIENAQENENEELECDLSAYVLFHEGNTGSPCLSFDILKDGLGEQRTCDQPQTCYFVTGSQGEQTHLNNIAVLKMSNLTKLKTEEEESEDESDDEDESAAVISSAIVKHNGCINRIRATTVGNTVLAASWSELQQVNIWDLNPLIESVDESRDKEVSQNSVEASPLFIFSEHSAEGFAVDWSPTVPGTLATGDCSKSIYVWTPTEGGSWSINKIPYRGHSKSVEDIQWSPNEPNVFASCSVDRSIRIWDTRAPPTSACMLACEDAHSSDVNVIHWNKNDPFIASGGDDTKVLIWDLRKFETKTPVAHLQYHTKPVCTVEWHPSDSSVLATGGEDDSIFQWDLAVEEDETRGKKSSDDVPQQLLFVHQGQKEVKELHWHSQVPGLVISTALSGFNVFKTISC